MIYIDPQAEIVAVKLSSWPDFLNDAMRLTTIRAIEAIAGVGLRRPAQDVLDPDFRCRGHRPGGWKSACFIVCCG
jgi:hypothetical protein